MSSGKNIESLLGDLGYSADQIPDAIDHLREKYKKAIRNYGKNNAYQEDEREAICDSLAEQLEKRAALKTYIKPKIKKSSISASELSDFVFCTASYAIKATYHVPKIDAQRDGTALHDLHYFEKYFKQSRSYPLSEGLTLEGFSIEKKTDNHSVHGKEFNELLKAKIIFKGHSTKRELPFYSTDRRFCGTPDYVLRGLKGNLTIVEEKHHFSKVPIHFPFASDMTQTLGYLYGLNFEEKPIKDAFLIYFHWGLNTYGSRRLRFTKVFYISKNNQNRNLLIGQYKELRHFQRNYLLTFNRKTLNIMKCLNCSQNAFCVHKGGKLDSVKLPYDYLDMVN
jgi:hypothetical protein